MKLDIRIPLGLLFVILGLLIALFGLAGPKDLYARSLGINVNLWWGLVLLLFGIFMLLLGRRGQSRATHSGVPSQSTGQDTTGQK